MRKSLELNAIANISILLDTIEEDFGHEYGIEDGERCFPRIKEQLDFLERYMIASAKALSEGNEPPLWHDVIRDPSKYPNNRGK